MNKKRIIICIMLAIFLLLISYVLIYFKPVVSEKRNELQTSGVGIIEKKINITIPKVYFSGNMENMNSKKDVRDIKVVYKDGKQELKCYATIKVQGSSSLAYEKKNYTINLFKDQNHSKKYEYDFGFGKQSKYCLKANWIDKTHSRNIVSARLSAELQKSSNRFPDAPNNGLIDGFPVEIYLNNEFLGLYTWNIPKDEWLWNLDKEDKMNVVVTFDAHTSQAQFKELITDPDKASFEVEVGEYSEELKENYNRLISFVKDSTDEEFVQNYEQYLDKESSINYAIMLYVLNGIDNLDKNMMLVSYDQKYWYPSLYDLDTTFGTNWDGKSIVSYDFDPAIGDCLLWNRFITLFHDDIVERYVYYRKHYLTKGHIMYLLNEFALSIPEQTIQAEREKWSDAPGYDYSQIEEYLDYKLPYLDNLFGVTIEE